jgi:excisionase family DNA binding protein
MPADTRAERVGLRGRDVAGWGDGASAGVNGPPRVVTAPTVADLAVLYGGRDRLLRVAEVAEQLGVCAATVYRLCEAGDLRHIRIVNSIRVRPADLAAFLERK